MRIRIVGVVELLEVALGQRYAAFGRLFLASSEYLEKGFKRLLSMQRGVRIVIGNLLGHDCAVKSGLRFRCDRGGVEGKVLEQV